METMTTSSVTDRDAALSPAFSSPGPDRDARAGILHHDPGQDAKLPDYHRGRVIGARWSGLLNRPPPSGLDLMAHRHPDPCLLRLRR